MPKATAVDLVIEHLWKESREGKVTPEELKEFLEVLPEWSVDQDGSVAVFSKAVPDIIQDGMLPHLDGCQIGVTTELRPGERHVAVLVSSPTEMEDLAAVVRTEQVIYERYRQEGFSWSEYQVLLRLPRPYKVIGEEVSMAESTVRTHVHNINSRLGLDSVSQLLCRGVEQGFIISPGITEQELQGLALLTPKMWETAELVELPYKEIARQRDVSISTVRTHLHQAYLATETTSKFELLHLLLRAEAQLEPDELEALKRNSRQARQLAKLQEEGLVETEDNRRPKAESGRELIERLQKNRYIELAKPEVSEIPESGLTEGFGEVTFSTLRYHDEESVREVIERIISKTAAVTSQDTYFLWNQETGQLFSRQFSAGSWELAAAQRRAGFRRFVGTAVQKRPGFGLTETDLFKYHIETSIFEDSGFDRDADYLESTDRLSGLLNAENGTSDPAFGRQVLANIDRATELHPGFESIVLQRPRRQTDILVRTLSDVPADAPDEHDLGVPLEHSDMEGLRIGFWPLDGEAQPGSDAEPKLEFCRYRGTIPSVPELAGNEWAALWVPKDTVASQKYMEAVAAAIGNGARVYVEGTSGRPVVLVPVSLEFGSSTAT